MLRKKVAYRVFYFAFTKRYLKYKQVKYKLLQIWIITYTITCFQGAVAQLVEQVNFEITFSAVNQDILQHLAKWFESTGFEITASGQSKFTSSVSPVRTRPAPQKIMVKRDLLQNNFHVLVS